MLTMRMICTVFAALLIVSANTYSQEINDNKTITQKDQKTEQKQAATKKEFASIQKQKSDEIKKVSNKSDTHPSEKLKIDREIAEYTGQLADFTKWLVIVTAILAVLTGGLVFMAKRQETGMRTVERAYIKMSHRPPGLITDGVVTTYITAQVKNFGRTPANITEVLITYKLLPIGEPLPAVPDYTRKGKQKNSPQAFLAPEEEFSYYEELPIGIEGITSIENAAPTHVLFAYGYTDYIDSFGQHHRAGYAREYRPSMNRRDLFLTDDDFKNRSNLVFVSQAGYNYDRKRKKGDGNDW